METRVRSLVKAASWQLLGLVTMSILGFLFTGSLTSGGALAAASGLLGFFTYLAHERAWAGIRWGWISATGTIHEPTSAER
ncbi:MAG TPA: DUF2061 domain-containing protein [Aurantimonas sp.]|uniref:DUF2061 domain-containing protein n=1 Tax=Aurantimonas marianensis TaxID=2920428 RepID=A0A9X2HBP7_9HYPH|nr:DUF2061 domain-containing protein [Aurantimonas marianensis]MCP3056960.1 DUF2061 domain-containing protein [Aurantimonas marianensis]